MNKINPLDTEECTQDIAGYLSQITNVEELSELIQVDGFTRSRLNRATKLLPLEQQALIRRLAESIANQRRSA